MRRFLVILPVLFAVILINSCKKDQILSKDHLEFSTDTILFDTVFTTVGSTTKKFKIYNNHNFSLNIDEIELMGGSSSPFRINVDGVSGLTHSDILIPGDDSLFIFVEVTLEVNNTTNPLIIQDSIRFRTNGLDQYVQLVVWGQDAYFHVNELVSGTWNNDKPHVIYGVAAVGYPGLDSNLALVIPAGTEVYCHKNGFLYVYKSTLDIQGQYENEVVFQGDRLESFYENKSGQWGGIIFDQANASTVDYLILKNSGFGLQVNGFGAPVTLTLSNSIIENTDFFGFIIAKGGTASVENCIFGKAGLMSTFLFGGGAATFTNCHFVNYWSGSRGGPAFGVKNYWIEDQVLYSGDADYTVYNSVFYGNVDDEFIIDTLWDSPSSFNMLVSNSLIKRNSGEYNYAYLQNITWNEDPLFTDPQEGDFTFNLSSPLNNAGSTIMYSSEDIRGVVRNASSPDIGAYEEL